MNRFEKNARVCFIGDSITHGHTYIAHIAAYYGAQFPDDRIRFYNTGISGASVGTMLDVFEIDIAPTHPTHAVIMLGVNDSGRDLLAGGCTPETYVVLRENLARYKERMHTLCTRLSDIGASIVLVTPPPIDEYGDHPTTPLPGSYALMLSYAEFLRAYATEHGYPLCDLFAYLTEASLSETLYREDRIHPTPRGHYHMAKGFLAFQGLTLPEEQPIPASMQRWCHNVGIHRNLRAAEYMLLHDYHLPPEAAVARAEALLAGGTLTAYFSNLCQCYIENKPREQALYAEILLDMEQNFKKN